MYHIKDDKRARASAELIYQGLFQCAAQKPWAQITITDVQKASSVSRATFYRHFDTLADVLYWRCDQCFREVWTDYLPADNADAYQLVCHFLQYWVTHSELLELLLWANRLDILYASHLNNLTLFQQKYAVITQVPTDHVNYFMGMRTGIMIGILMAWLQNDKRESADELLTIVKDQFAFIRHNDFVL